MSTDNSSTTQSTPILKVLVGSHAHGLAHANSDIDYRGVFVLPTSELLKVSERRSQRSWTDASDDDSSWEIGHYLLLAVKSNPTVLETFLAPRVDEGNPWGDPLRALFPAVWSSRAVREAFLGYGLSQRKEFLSISDKRRTKYAAAYLRVLYNGWELLQSGTFTVRIADTQVGDQVRAFKEGDFSTAEVIEICEHWQHKIEEAYARNPAKKVDIDKVNDLLLAIRREFW